MMNAPKLNGVVKWWDATKGYGFIKPEGGTKDVFVHISALEHSGLPGLSDNQRVQFELKEGRGGRMSAINLQVSQATQVETAPGADAPRP
ncbi:MAG: cold-shock protein [Rhodobacteraceae bacterium]|nr:cold-shock protein [Paracoccaceae bacterium]MBR9820384.1 cold-shock protein [Paracoccaceae bacterium]